MELKENFSGEDNLKQEQLSGCLASVPIAVWQTCRFFLDYRNQLNNKDNWMEGLSEKEIEIKRKNWLANYMKENESYKIE
jgi:hypothetical protein